jgi:riboflavin kinase
MELQGTLCSGLGEGATFTELDWVAHEFRERLGFAPHPGTVNLSLTGDEWLKVRARLKEMAGIAIIPPPGFCAAKCFSVLLNGRVGGFAILPDVPDYPATKLEIVAPVFVRQELNLQDGDCVNLRIDIE